MTRTNGEHFLEDFKERPLKLFKGLKKSVKFVDFEVLT